MDRQACGLLQTTFNGSFLVCREKYVNSGVLKRFVVQQERTKNHTFPLTRINKEKTYTFLCLKVTIYCEDLKDRY
jgi:hypothetical protein